jgi:hypothetical protein
VPLDATHLGKAIARTASATWAIGLRSLQRCRLHLYLEVIRQLSASLSLDHETRFAVGNAEKTLQHLFGRDRITVTRQRVRMRVAGDYLAVDPHAVAIENNQIERHLPIFRRITPRLRAC